MKRQCKLGKERQNTIKSLITLRIEQETELEPQHKFKRKEENNAMILPTLLSPGGLNDAAVVQTPRVLFPRFPPCSSTAWMAVPYLPPLYPQQSRSSSVSSLRMRSSRVQLEGLGRGEESQGLPASLVCLPGQKVGASDGQGLLRAPWPARPGLAA